MFATAMDTTAIDMVINTQYRGGTTTKYVNQTLATDLQWYTEATLKIQISNIKTQQQILLSPETNQPPIHHTKHHR